MSLIKSILMSIVTGVLRNFLLTVSTWLLTQQIVDESTAGQIATLLPVFLAAVVWSVLEKYALGKLHLNQLLTALNLPEGSSPEDLKYKLKNDQLIEQLDKENK